MTRRITIEQFENSIDGVINGQEKEFHFVKCVLCGAVQSEASFQKIFDRSYETIPREKKPTGICKKCFSGEGD